MLRSKSTNQVKDEKKEDSVVGCFFLLCIIVQTEYHVLEPVLVQVEEQNGKEFFSLFANFVYETTIYTVLTQNINKQHK